MTQYMLSVHVGDEGYSDPKSTDTQRMYAQVDVFNNELRASGAWVFAGGMHPASTATLVTSKDGKTTNTDGPYMKNDVQLGGFWVIDVADRDTALVWAGKGSAACEGPVEVREFQG
jgi:hypothetical protein